MFGMSLVLVVSFATIKDHVQRYIELLVVHISAESSLMLPAEK